MGIDRREPNLRRSGVDGYLPAFYAEEHPRFAALLERYYEYLQSPESPARLVQDLPRTRDIAATDDDLLDRIEGEYLLGRPHFDGFIDKRRAATYSPFIFAAKGTKLSIQQFFRMFHGIDPLVTYTKDNIFLLDDDASRIGENSLRYLADDKLYQTYALLIQTKLPASAWIDSYKLFVHPAGMYVGAEILLVSRVEDEAVSVRWEPAPADRIYESKADDGAVAYSETTILTDDDSPRRINPRSALRHVRGETIASAAGQFSDIGELEMAGSPTFDDESLDFSCDLPVPTFDMDGRNP